MKDFRRVIGDFLHRRGSRKQPVISVDDPSLRVIVTAFDETEAASTALDRAQHWNPHKPAVLRHHLVLPESRVESARIQLEQDQWLLRPQGQADELEKSGESPVMLSALRVQHLDALHCSQESSRMAGLAQRMDGRALGWDALQPDTGTDSTSDYCSRHHSR